MLFLKCYFKNKFDGKFVPPSGPSDSKSNDCTEEIGGTAKLLIG